MLVSSFACLTSDVLRFGMIILSWLTTGYGMDENSAELDRLKGESGENMPLNEDHAETDNYQDMYFKR